jgi:hypothetical protein
MKRAPRIRLRTFFLVFFCAALGLTIGTRPETEENKRAASLGMRQLQLDWHYACLAAASVAIVVGLLQQAAGLSESDLGDVRECQSIRLSIFFSIGWRLLCAGLLIVCLLTTVLISAQFVDLPESEAMLTYELFPYIVWVGCIALVLVASLNRWRPRRERRASSLWRSLFLLISGPVIVLLILPDLGFVHYLVHIATQGIESAQPLVYRRPGEFPEHSAEGFRTFWTSLAACGWVFLAAAFLFIANYAALERRRLRQFGIVAFIVALTLVAGYCIWYYSIEFHRISPYMAAVGAGTNWLERLAGIAIVLIFVTAGAYHAALRSEPSIAVFARGDGSAVTPFYESVVWLLVLTVAMSIYLFESVRSFFSPLYLSFASARDGMLFVAEIAGSIFRDAESLLVILVGVASLELCWLRWRRCADNVEWRICAFDARRFAWNWAALALLAIVGIPTLSSFCFVYWLGPWYLYQP